MEQMNSTNNATRFNGAKRETIYLDGYTEGVKKYGITPNPANRKIREDNVEKIKKSVLLNGVFPYPIIVRATKDKNGKLTDVTLIDGGHRHEAFLAIERETGMKLSVDVRVMLCDENFPASLYDEVMIRVNRESSAKWDFAESALGTKTLICAEFAKYYKTVYPALSSSAIANIVSNRKSSTSSKIFNDLWGLDTYPIYPNIDDVIDICCMLNEKRDVAFGDTCVNGVCDLFTWASNFSVKDILKEVLINHINSMNDNFNLAKVTKSAKVDTNGREKEKSWYGFYFDALKKYKPNRARKDNWNDFVKFVYRRYSRTKEFNTMNRFE